VKPLAFLRSRLLSIPVILRMALEPLIPKRRNDADESIGSFVRRRFGNEVCQRIVDPLMSGIYAGDSDDLSIESTFPRLRNVEREHRSVIRGLLATSRAAKAAASGRKPMFLSLRSGMGRLVEALAQRLDPTAVQTGASVTSLRRDDRYRLHLSNGTKVSAGALVLAIPAFAAAALVEQLDRDLADLLREIPYVSTATVSLAFRRSDIQHPLNGFGFVVPRVERRRITACTWVSTKLPPRAPKDTVLLRCFIGRAGDDDWAGASDAELVGRSLTELRDLMGIDSPPLFTRVFRWENSMPQYRVGHQELLRRIDARVAAHPNLFLAGSAYRGVGLPDVIREATAVSSAVAAAV
jgi:oxygen-dependent protoporphyrinogen oxidase